MTDPRDERPRPQYGEYATPEEQRARIRQPDATSALDSGMTTSPAEVKPPETATPDSEGLQRRHVADRAVTIALLAFGAFNVIVSATTYLDLASLAQRAMDALGIPGEFTNVESAHTWGIVAACVLVVGYLATAALAIGNLRRRRSAWWIPIVGAVITYAIVAVCVSVPLFGDPAFVAYSATLSR